MNRDGNYENNLKASSPPIDGLSQRLLSAMMMGITITYADGHRWIDANGRDEDERPSLNQKLAQRKLPEINSKCYGSILMALDRIDGALMDLKEPSLQERFDSELWGI